MWKTRRKKNHRDTCFPGKPTDHTLSSKRWKIKRGHVLNLRRNRPNLTSRLRAGTVSGTDNNTSPPKPDLLENLCLRERRKEESNNSTRTWDHQKKKGQCDPATTLHGGQSKIPFGLGRDKREGKDTSETTHSEAKSDQERSHERRKTNWKEGEREGGDVVGDRSWKNANEACSVREKGKGSKLYSKKL